MAAAKLPAYCPAPTQYDRNHWATTVMNGLKLKRKDYKAFRMALSSSSKNTF
jgi:hypothetical protein